MPMTRMVGQLQRSRLHGRRRTLTLDLCGRNLYQNPH